MEQPRTKPLVSVIIPTCNSQANIKSCLDSIKRQTYKKIETIVVDRFSSDQTAEIAKRSKAKVLPLDSERSEAKNYAAKKSNGSFIFFLDSDMMLTSQVIEECVKNCLQKELDGIIVPEEYFGQGMLGQWRKTEKETLCESSDAVLIPRFFKKTGFLNAGGYDEKLVCGEDFDFFRRFERCGYKTGKISSKIVHVEGNPSLRGVLSKAYYYGKTIPALLKKSPSRSIERYASLRLTSIENAGTAFKSAGSLLGFAAVKMFEYVAYFLGICTQLAGGFFENPAIKKLKSKLREGKFALASVAIILLVSVVIFRNLLFTAEWPGGGDVMGFVSRAYLYGKDFRWLYMWRPYSFGFVEGINFMDFFLMLHYLVFRDPSWTVKTFMFLSYLVAAFSMYIFAHRYTRMHLASLAASLVYILNQWLFSQLTEAHADIVFSYALAPLIFMLFDKALQTGKARDIVLFCGGLSLFITSFHPECIVIYSVFLALFATFFILLPSKNETIKAHLLRSLKVLLPSTLIVFMLSAFFLVPFFMNIRSPYFHPSYEYPLEDAFMSSYQNITDAFTLRGVEKWGYNNVVDVYSQLGMPDFPVYCLLLIIFILAYFVLLIRRDRYTLFFAASTFISVFIAKGPNPPFGQIFIWAWFNIPHFAIFRAANRWVMMAIFSDAFFISILVYYLAKYAKKEICFQQGEKYFTLRVKTDKLSKFRKIAVSMDTLNCLSKKSGKVLRVLSIVLLSFILLSGIFSCFYFFSQGLQVYTPPKQYLAPLQWLSSQQDDYKVVSVGRSAYEWLVSPDQYSDFASSSMQTTLGWGHDIGFDSSFIHDKPVLQDGGWEFRTREFVDHLRFKLAREELTDNLLKVLGPFAYKYVVLPSYVTNKTCEFFLNQTGYQVIYNQTALVLQNEYASPRVFAADQSMLVLGGLESFDALCKIDDFNLSATPLFFTPNSSKENVCEDNISKFGMFSFVNTDILDLAMASLDEGTNFIYAGDYGAPSINTTAYWVKMSSWRNVGALVLSGDTLTTSGKNRIDIPFTANSQGDYSIWLRVGFAPSRGKLSIFVDNELIQELHTESSLWSKLAWTNITELSLTAGKHSIAFENDGTGYNDIDAFAIVKPSDLESKTNEAISTLQSFSGRLLYLLDAENVFLDNSGNWHGTLVPYDGYVIYSDTLGLNVAPQAFANASSSSDSFDASLANDGNSNTRWTSEKYVLPQWLELTWDRPQELRGCRILFENAYATNYSIQTWNGSDWVDQALVADNNALDRVHKFTEPVQTTKLRIYVGTFSIYDRVSIWEIEAFSTESATQTTKITIPRKGNYMLAARVATGPNYGTICFKLNDKFYPISCNSSTNDFEWREIGPFNFDVGQRSLSVGGVDLVELDEILIYSLKGDEVSLTMPQLFNATSPSVSVTYDEVNPCTYQVHVDANEPFMLIFSEAYSPFWKAIINGEEIPSTLAYSMVNSFYINRTGQFTVIIYFTGQTYANTGLIISFVSFVSISVATPVLSIVLRRRRLLKPKS